MRQGGRAEQSTVCLQASCAGNGKNGEIEMNLDFNVRLNNLMVKDAKK